MAVSCEQDSRAEVLVHESGYSKDERVFSLGCN